jgi:cAMP-dependent protein kinase regulator
LVQVEKQAGEEIIRQSDVEADNFYVVAKGVCKCYQGAHDETGLVAVCEPGDGFGELALMYSTARQASVLADTDVSLWALDRGSFKALLMQAALERGKRHKDFLDQVSAFTALQTSETQWIADTMEDVCYQDGQVIFNQGDKSEDIFLVQEGEVVVSQVSEASGTTGDTPEPEPEPAADGGALLTLHRGDYFGYVLAMSARFQMCCLCCDSILH